MSRRVADFQTIRSEGGLLPPDLLRRVLDPAAKLEGTRPEDYGLSAGERLNEAITQSWNRLRKHWAEFSAAAAGLPAGEPGTGLTNDRWNLPLLRELGFGFLPTAAGPEIGGRTFAINRFYGPVPVHLVGRGLDLDKRAAGVRGAASAAPHGLAQELLNRSPDYLWAIVSNGLRFRILRDNQALSRQSFLEFDLEAVFTGEVYSDFVLLWLIAHATRFAPRDGGRPETCWLEQRMREAQDQGTRALGDLRGGVERALQTLGQGLTSHPKNTALREALRSGRLPLADFHGQLLRVIYRLIFLFVAEDRAIEGVPLLHPRDSSEAGRLARERYAEHYSTGRLRHLASAIKGSRHGDLWRQFQLLIGALSGDPAFAMARERLALPALGSFLWSPDSTAALNEAELTNHDVLEALRNLAFTRQGKVLRPVDYRNLGAEELGGVYEGLLALTPQIGADGAHFNFAEFAGNERKTSGSYYTPDSLVQCLLDSALDPVVAEALQGKSGPAAEKAILDLKVCDPAVGSGHFLVGAAHRLARHLARVRALAQGESEPSPLLYQHALRDVIGRCLYGVDINPMAAELCRVSLWLEALEPGKPLSFLEHHIRVGNSLIGATPELISAGLPDDAFIATESDDRRACSVLERRNRAERSGLGPLFAQQEAEAQARLQDAASELDDLPDDRPEDIRAKESAFRRHEETDEYRRKTRLADAWCAAFVMNKHFRETGKDATVFGITQGKLNDIADRQTLPLDLADEIERLAARYQFFHWHLAFPEAFQHGGFAVTVGNPPWRMTEDDSRLDEPTEIGSGADAVSAMDPAKLKRERAFLARSGRYPLSAQNRLQLARIFAELFGSILCPSGAAGMIVPSTLTVNAFDRALWSSWVRNKTLASVWDFVNLGLLFPDVDSRQKFSVICLRKTTQSKFRARCWMTDPSLLKEQDEQAVELTDSDLLRFSGSELALPHFHGRKDLILLDRAIARFGRVSESVEWATEYVLLGATNDPDFKRERRRADGPGDDLQGAFSAQEWIPVYEGKMVASLDHRVARVIWKPGNAKRRAQEEALSVAEKQDPNVFATPLWEVPRSLVSLRDPLFSQRGWDIGLCDVTSALNERTLVAAVVPLCFATHNLPLVRVCDGNPKNSLLFLAALGSFVLDYFARLRVATNHLTEGIFNSLPIPSPAQIHLMSTTCFADKQAASARAIELSFTAWDLSLFAQACGWSGPPFRWDEERRFLLRCELDAAFLHLYLPGDAKGEWQKADRETEENLSSLKESFATPRDAVAYIMDTFPIVLRKDKLNHNGDYRTKRVILEIYDAMQEAMRTGQPYQTRLDPPPADLRCCHPPRTPNQ